MFGKGMFMDGILYAIISQNVAHDICGLWSLKITDSLYPHFNEHPPLVFALQSQFFKFFGDAYWVERLYSLTTVIVSAGLIYFVYRQISQLSFVINVLGNSKVPPQPDENSISTKSIVFPSSAWVLLLWISVPIVNRCAQNNMLENTMLVFVLASVWCYFQFLKFKLSSSVFSETNGTASKTQAAQSFVWLFLSGSMLLLAFMAKGFTGLFPFALPAIVVWVLRKDNYSALIKPFIQQTATMLLGFAISFALMTWLFPESASALQRYYDKQVLGSLEKVQTVSTRFKILGDYFLALLPMILLSLLLQWGFTRNGNFTRKTNKQISFSQKLKFIYRKFAESPWTQILILLSLTGVLPIMISLKQSDYYIYCVFPFVAMSVVLVFDSAWLWLENKLLEIRFWPVALGCIILFFGGWGYVQAGKVQRDKQLWNDINKIVEVVQVYNASQQDSILENQIVNGGSSQQSMLRGNQKSMVRANQGSEQQSDQRKEFVLGSFRALKDDWYLQAYLYRYFGITVQNYRVPNDEKNFEYYLTPKSYTRDSLQGLKPMNLGLKSYELWRR